VSVIVGPSGGGKSTFLRCLNGLETFEAGSIAVGDLEVSGQMTPQARKRQLDLVRRRVGMVFQQFNLFPHRTVLGNVIEAPVHVLGRSRDEAMATARSLLERVGLGDKLDRWPDTLSGGQQQRVAIARALAMGPEVMLFDEPTSALDPRMAAEVESVITDLARSGQTMVVVTHSMRLARRAAHTVHVFEGGRVLESGEPGQIFEAPKEPATRQFLTETDTR
jgi:ABC-type polar amino acid transport system ATPase subunit